MEFRDLVGFFGDSLPARIVSNIKTAFSIGEKARAQDVFGAQARPSDIQVYMVPGLLSILLTSAGDRIGYTFVCAAKVELPPNDHGHIAVMPCAHEFRILGDYTQVDMACSACKARGVQTQVNVQRLLEAMLPRDKDTGEPVKTEETLSRRDAMLPIRYLGNIRGRNAQPRLVSTWDDVKSGETEYAPTVIDSIAFGGPR
jgi:hypothetical protein